jgi:ornithine cyclodeaminase/alanine dehydrogenase-like protein (mu-crystallin family)
MPLILSRKDLRQLLTMADVIEAVERGFREYKAGKCAIPVRMPVKIEKSETSSSGELSSLIGG